ncbi:transglycosylase domain-containing protein [Acidipila rosea]|uniref:Penicillin-binding protein 1B n=1 Tax=Acidipila rosea TaxID=768535 RepID=A0A4R1L3T1_9BACT|nr:transglycosylase domain-containing protein [Acidipila rosea]TCK71737.1 penicillin-binding protein 1B [Acidipila rosea]
MALKIKLPRPRSASGKRQPVSRKVWQIAGIAAAFVLLFFFAIFGFYYHRYKNIVDERMNKPLFENTAKIYAAPREVRPGQKLTVAFLAEELHEAGYSVEGRSPASPMGTYSLTDNSITVHPGPQSYHEENGDSATILVSRGSVKEIDGDNKQQLDAYEMEPLLITALSDQNRAKRRLVTYGELPKYLVPAVTSIEDRRFFQHGGVDYVRLAGAMLADLRSRRYREGGSTLTMQLARGFFLTPQKHVKRKLIEVLITFQLEHRFTKQQIFQMYANEIPLGQRGSFAINGFGEAARAYFDKDISQLNLPECALLAGMIQSPSRLNPYRHPTRAIERRNLVLDTMVETGDITRAQADIAKGAPLNLASQSIDANQAPYFVDLVRDQLNQRLGENDWNREGLRIYTSLDPQLESAATEAIDESIKKVDELILKRHTRKLKNGTVEQIGGPVTYPQVALIALNPHTGQVLALVGGRNYGMSQYNHAVAHRPTGSIFKPFVFAAAFNSSIAGAQLTGDGGQSAIFTPVTMLNDEQTTFNFGNDQEYTPKNFKNEYSDQLTARDALILSRNNATISLAQMVGFDNVASLARDAGIKSARATPSVAIGSYDATPLEMAGAYTVFANGGVRMDPQMLASIRTSKGDPLYDYAPNAKPVLDPRAAFLTLSLMEDVMNTRHGTAAGVRSQYDFRAPAAGKTGTSHDAWFAGFTSNLLCIVWVGNDDYSDIKLQGAQAALPIWAEFMKRAVKLPQYSDTKDFDPPGGVTLVNLDQQTNLLADASCPDDYTAAFLDGTQPTDTCDHANGDQRNIFQKIFGIGQKPATPPAQTTQAAPQQSAQPVQTAPAQQPANAANNNAQDQNQPKKKKRGFFSKLFGVGKNDDKKQPDNTQPQ